MPLHGVTYGNNRYVAVGHEGVALTSPDAITWTVHSAGTIATLHSVCFGKGLFVAVAQNGLILTSSNGASWTPRSSGTTLPLFDVIWANGWFVAVGGFAGREETRNSPIVTSTDGVTWRSRDSATSWGLSSLAFGNAGFVAVGNTGVILQSEPFITLEITPTRALSLTAASGRTYRLEATGTLGAHAPWLPLAEVFLTGTSTNLAGLLPVGAAQNFIRARSLP